MRSSQRLIPALFSIFALYTSAGQAAMAPCGTLPDRVFDNGFGVGAVIDTDTETVLTVDVTGLQFFPDEHSSFLPPAAPGDDFVFFESGTLNGNQGALVLQADPTLQTFTLAPGYSSPVLSSPLGFQQCAPADNPDLDSEFDENYAGPGSVFQDPTRNAGNLIMVYEAENHCRSGQNVNAYYASVGFARSSDNGKTWEQPSIMPPPGSTRYAIVTGPDPKPAYDAALGPNGQPPVGDAIPSAYVEGGCMYVVYAHHPVPGSNTGHPAAIQIARANLGADPLAFDKFVDSGSVRGFVSAGLGGGAIDVIPYVAAGTSSPTPVCTGAQFQAGLSYNNHLHRYLMTMACNDGTPGELAWFFSTATSLELEDWTPPQMIANTPKTETACGASGNSFDGWYPSLYSLNTAAGHTGTEGVAFYLDGCNTNGTRSFNSRHFTVTADPG